MSNKIKIFVVDTSPLITLAAAGSLDYLFYPDAKIIIPDAVFYEATDDSSKLGATDIINWAQVNHQKIEITPTHVFRIFRLAQQSDPHVRQAGLGEQAAVEVINHPAELAADEKGILLCEETAVLKRVTIEDKEKIIELSTMDFLKMLEQTQRIQSFQYVLEQARAAGRNVSAYEHIFKYSPETKQAIRDIFQLVSESGDRK